MKVDTVTIDDEYITVLGTDSILTIAKKIAEAGIPDAVVVDEDNTVLGALDDYDIISKAVAPEKDLEATTAQDIMFTTPPVYLHTELEKVEELMQQLEISILPVVDDNQKLLGVVTMMDLMEGLAYENRSWLDRLLGR